MKPVLFIFLSLMISQSAFAGDAGYASQTCVSASQRTVLTALTDWFNDTRIYTLVIDGVPAIYNLSDSGTKEVGDDGVLTVSKNGVDVFKTDFNVETGIKTLTVYMDPRTGTIAEHSSTPTPITIQLQCKDFWPNP